MRRVGTKPLIKDTLCILLETDTCRPTLFIVPDVGITTDSLSSTIVLYLQNREGVVNADIEFHLIGRICLNH